MTAPMPEWFPEFCDKLAALTPTDMAELLATLPPDDATSERCDRPKPAKRRKPSVSKLIAHAEKSGKPVTSVTTPDGVTLRFGESEPSNELDEWIAKHAH
jgi:hypothetical protein